MHLQQIISEIDFNENEKKEWAYKFIADAPLHIERCYKYFEIANPPPKSSVFEIGPGCCYFLWFCRERECSISGVDAESNVYSKTRTHLKINIKEERVKPFEKISFGKSFDLIISLLATFCGRWEKSAHVYFLEDCYDHLTENGRLIMNFNPEKNFHVNRSLYKGHLCCNNDTYILTKESIKAKLNDYRISGSIKNSK